MEYIFLSLLQISCHPYLFHKKKGIKQSPPTQPHSGGRHTYDAALTGAPKEL
jgi:hypothetical protein